MLGAFLLIPFTGESGAAHAISTPPVTKCSIEIGNPHISKYLIRSRGVIAVKVNAQSKCEKPMRDLILTVEIYKVGVLVDYKVRSSEQIIYGFIYPNKVIKNEKTYIRCTSNKWTKYYGVAFATGIVEGKRLRTLHVRSEKIKNFQCGN